MQQKIKADVPHHSAKTTLQNKKELRTASPHVAAGLTMTLCKTCRCKHGCRSRHGYMRNCFHRKNACFSKEAPSCLHFSFYHLRHVQKNRMVFWICENGPSGTFEDQESPFGVGRCGVCVCGAVCVCGEYHGVPNAC